MACFVVEMERILGAPPRASVAYFTMLCRFFAPTCDYTIYHNLTSRDGKDSVQFQRVQIDMGLAKCYIAIGSEIEKVR